MSVTSPPHVDAKPPGHRILVCLDRSPLSELCLPYAIAVAKTFESEMTLVYVMQPEHEHGPHTADALGWEIARQEARGYLERHQQEAAQALGRAVDVRLEQGHPAERIVTLARELGAALTILGSHGEGGVTARNLGSTVQQVLSVMHGSVFVVRSSLLAPTEIFPRQVLVPLDGSVRTESVLPAVARIVNATGAALLLVHVVQEPVASAVMRAGEELELASQLATRLETSAKAYLERVRERIAHDVGSVRTLVVRHTNERQGLIEVCQREHVDLVVVSAHGVACDSARSHGSVTAHLLTHASVPLLVLQDLEREVEQPPDLREQLAPPLPASYPPGVA